MISSSSRKGSPPSVAPMFPFQVNEYPHPTEWPAEGNTHHGPEDALQLEDQISVLTLQPVPADELCELCKVPLVVQDLTTQLCLRHDSVEVRRHDAVECAS